MNEVNEMKRFVAREIERGGNLELACGVLKEANLRKILENKEAEEKNDRTHD